jgi:hypothetical protein
LRFIVWSSFNDLPPDFWTGLSWKILIYDPWPVGGIFREEDEVFRRADCIHFAPS